MVRPKVYITRKIQDEAVLLTDTIDEAILTLIYQFFILDKHLNNIQAVKLIM
jgi:hypothetical protein